MEITSNEKREQVHFRLKKDTKSMLSELAEVTGRTQNALAETAIEQFCDLQKWQINAINNGISEANNGQFTSHEDIKVKWEEKHENCLD